MNVNDDFHPQSDVNLLNYYECNAPSIYVLERCSYYEKKL